MIMIVGLGNPGKEFINTRHNIGFSILNNFQKRNRFLAWREIKRLRAKVSKGKLGGKKIILAKPQTFMNNSGQSVRLLISRYRLPVTNLFVVHDDLDITLGKIKISKAKSSAGHKGVQSIIDELGTRNFVRFRIGAQQTTNNKQQTTKDKLVLKRFTKEEEKILKETKKTTCDALEIAIKKGVESAMNKYNK